MTSMETSNITREALKSMFAQGKRFDSRDLLDFRPISLSLDIANTAEGSARVKIGKTEVIAGVKLQLGTPYPDSPNQGNLMVTSDFLPLASPRFEQGPPKFPAIELPRLVDRGIRESHMIDLSSLVVEPGEKVWTVIIDIYPINDDGNLIGAASIAAAAALKNTRIPNLDDSGNIDYKTKSDKPLPLKPGVFPIAFTFYKLSDSLILDPTREEEEAADGFLMWGITEIDGQKRISSAQKSGGGKVIFTQAEIERMMTILPGKLDEVNAKLKNFL